jgi:hypothetical protein
LKTDVVVIRGPRRGRRGYIYGSIEQQHPMDSKTWVFFGKTVMVALPFADLELAREGEGVAPQLDLFERGEITA